MPDRTLLLALLPLLAACTTNGVTGELDFLGEVWADNWSSMYVDGELVMEDSVSITTERSFNAEFFEFDAVAPFQVAVVLKDFKENDSGLEYIGAANQQMGDGGYIAQLSDQQTGEIVLVSDAGWSCLVIHEAPLDTSCEDSSSPLTDCSWTTTDEPDGWTDAEFDDSGWSAATVHSEGDVDPKDGYDEISWDASAELIWGSDLETHNTVLCRVTVE